VTDNRTARRAQLDIYLNKYVDGVPYLARASNISPTGLSVAHLIEPHHSEKRVGVQFQLPGSGELIYAEGEVVRRWSGKKCKGSGIRFTLIAARHREMIHKFVERAEG
jgi:hypothetical protein